MLTSAEEVGQARTSEKFTKPRHSLPTSLLFCNSSLPVWITFSGQRERFARSEVPWKPSEQRWGRYRSTPLVGKVPVVNGARNYIVLERHGQNGSWSVIIALKVETTISGSSTHLCEWRLCVGDWKYRIWSLAYWQNAPNPPLNERTRTCVLHDEGLTRGMLCYAFSLPATRWWWCAFWGFTSVLFH